METSKLISLLKVKRQTIIDRIIPKKQLYNILSTPNEKNMVQKQLVKLHWFASFKPSTIKVPANETITEVEILFAEIRDFNQAKKLFKIIGKVIPYPLIILFTDGEKYMFMGANYTSKKNGFFKIEKIISSPPHSEEKFKKILTELDWDSFLAIDLGTYYKGILDFISLTNFFDGDIPINDLRQPEGVLTIQQEIKALENKAKRENQLNLKIDILKQVDQKKEDLQRLLKGDTFNE
jgi:hypothetical protein